MTGNDGAHSTGALFSRQGQTTMTEFEGAHLAALLFNRQDLTMGTKTDYGMSKVEAIKTTCLEVNF